MPDDVPSMDVSEQTWSDSATNVPEEEASEESSLNETYQEMPSPTAAKADLPGLTEPPHHLSKHVLSMYSGCVRYFSPVLLQATLEDGLPIPLALLRYWTDEK